MDATQYTGQGAGAIAIVVPLLIILVMLVSGWKIFTKAGKPGWAIIIPIYNIIVLLEIVKKPIWWLILFLIPLVNVVIMIVVAYLMVKHFGQPGWHVVLYILLPIFYLPYLAFSSAQYTESLA